LKVTEKIRMRRMPVQNAGIACPISTTGVSTRSGHRPRFSAMIMPAPIPSTADRTSAESARLTVYGIRWVIRVRAGSCCT
jgi:hypothetical protein